MNLWSNPAGEALALRRHAEAVAAFNAREREQETPKPVRKPAPVFSHTNLAARAQNFGVNTIAVAAGVGRHAVRTIQRGGRSMPVTLLKVATALDELEKPKDNPYSGLASRLVGRNLQRVSDLSGVGRMAIRALRDGRKTTKPETARRISAALDEMEHDSHCPTCGRLR